LFQLQNPLVRFQQSSPPQGSFCKPDLNEPTWAARSLTHSRSPAKGRNRPNRGANQTIS
jgi:hypothetical protein